VAAASVAMMAPPAKSILSAAVLPPAGAVKSSVALPLPEA